MSLWLSLLIGCAWIDASDVDAFYDQDNDGLPFGVDCDDADPRVLTGYTVFQDGDQDGWGDTNSPATACAVTAGWALQPGDCDDLAAITHPGATERCGGGDEDCDGGTDDLDPDGVLDAPRWYIDADQDDFGTGEGVSACAPISGRAQVATDCNDADEAIHPGAPETCGGIDADCDFRVDDADPDTTNRTIWFLDGDGDGFGDADASIALCAAPPLYVALGTDCDDADASASPAATEQCGGTDEDCDGLTDDADPSVHGVTTWYADTDEDGFGDRASPSLGCVPGGRVVDATDCDDARPLVNPAAQELCDSANTDEDCDGAAEDLDGDVTGAQRYYVDGDGDDHGAPDAPEYWCDPPADVAPVGDDCDDLRGDVYPGAPEVWYDGVDEDCDYKSDADADADGHDDAAHGGDDCDDQLATTYPGATDAWYDGVDANCDGLSDADADLDGHDDAGHGGDDCDDRDARIHPGVPEIWYDGVDQDCAGDDDFDADADGHDAASHGGDDCDDLVATTYRGADEFVDGVDSNCDGQDYVCGSTIRRVPRDLPTPQAAIAPSCPGDTVRISPGDWSGPFVVLVNITVEGVGPGVRLVGSGSGPVVTTSRATFRNLTITGGNATVFPGGGGMKIENGSGARLEDLVITGNQSASWGGGITVYNSAFVRVDNVRIEDNTGGAGGGMMLASSPDARISNSTFRGNVSTSSGGGLFVSGSDRLTIVDTAFDANSSAGDGGGAYFGTFDTATLLRDSFTANDAASSAGFAISSGKNWTITDVDVFDNVAAGSVGGAGFSYNDTCVLEGLNVRGNASTRYGGLSFYESTCTVRDAHIWENEGVGLNSGYTPLGFLVEGAQIDTNSGGGLTNQFGSVSTFRDISLRGNRAFAIWNDAPSTLENVVVEDTINTGISAVRITDTTLRGLSVTGSARHGVELYGRIDAEGLISAANLGVGLTLPSSGLTGTLDHVSIVGNGGVGLYSSTPAPGPQVKHLVSANNLIGIRAPADGLQLAYCHLASNASAGSTGGISVTGCSTGDPKFQTFGFGLLPEDVDLHLRPGSPLRDAGVAAGDADGTKGDIGAYGGVNDYFDAMPWYADLDGDTLPDGWEQQYGLDPSRDDRANDLDADGLTNLVEYTKGTAPSRADTDVDGLDDKTELTNGTDPTSPFSP